MNKYKNLILFTAIIVVITAFVPNIQKFPQDTTKTKKVIVADTTKSTYEKIFKQQEEVNKSLDDILLERKQQQQKMDKKVIK